MPARMPSACAAEREEAAMRHGWVGIIVTMLTFSAFAERRQDVAYPTVAKDQSRPAVRLLPAAGGDTPSNLQDDPCNIDPAWCGGGNSGDEYIAGRWCPQLCTSRSCGIRCVDSACRSDRSTGALYYYCGAVAGRSCDGYTRTNGTYVCQTCVN